MSRLSCYASINNRNNFYLLNDNCTNQLDSVKIPVTASIYFLDSLLAAFLGFIIYWRYNSISILNLKIRIDAISNTWWIIYYVFVGLRSILNCIRYSLGTKLEGFFLSDWILVTLETLILCFGLNYQRKYRSSSQINEEIDYYSKTDRKQEQFSLRRGIFKTVLSSGTVVALIALICFGVIPVFALTSRVSNHILWFWVYFGFSSLLHLAALFLAMFILLKKSADGPSILMKLFLCAAVMLLLPADIPMFVWKQCAKMQCLCNFMTIFDVWVLLKVLSGLSLFFAVRLEYLRLKQECQWAMLNEVQRFSF